MREIAVSSSKGVCKESKVCYLQEIDYIQSPCDPPCYEQESEAEILHEYQNNCDEQPRTDKNTRSRSTAISRRATLTGFDI